MSINGDFSGKNLIVSHESTSPISNEVKSEKDSKISKAAKAVLSASEKPGITGNLTGRAKELLGLNVKVKISTTAGIKEVSVNINALAKAYGLGKDKHAFLKQTLKCSSCSFQIFKTIARATETTLWENKQELRTKPKQLVSSLLNTLANSLNDGQGLKRLNDQCIYMNKSSQGNFSAEISDVGGISISKEETTNKILESLKTLRDGILESGGSEEKLKSFMTNLFDGNFSFEIMTIGLNDLRKSPKKYDACEKAYSQLKDLLNVDVLDGVGFDGENITVHPEGISYNSVEGANPFSFFTLKGEISSAIYKKSGEELKSSIEECVANSVDIHQKENIKSTARVIIETIFDKENTSSKDEVSSTLSWLTGREMSNNEALISMKKESRKTLKDKLISVQDKLPESNRLSPDSIDFILDMVSGEIPPSKEGIAKMQAFAQTLV
jgi:hypothetical protein